MQRSTTLVFIATKMGDGRHNSRRFYGVQIAELAEDGSVPGWQKVLFSSMPTPAGEDSRR
jgi:hypothetical protein